MRVRLLHFAQIRELCGLSEEYLFFQNTSSVLTAWHILCNRHPDLNALAYKPLPALNGSFANWDATLADGDDLVFLSPMSGG